GGHRAPARGSRPPSPSPPALGFLSSHPRSGPLHRRGAGGAADRRLGGGTRGRPRPARSPRGAGGTAAFRVAGAGSLPRGCLSAPRARGPRGHRRRLRRGRREAAPSDRGGGTSHLGAQRGRARIGGRGGVRRRPGASGALRPGGGGGAADRASTRPVHPRGGGGGASAGAQPGGSARERGLGRATGVRDPGAAYGGDRGA